MVDRDNSLRLRKEHPWLWAVRPKWSLSDPVNAMPIEAGHLRDTRGERSCELWVKATHGAVEEVKRADWQENMNMALAAATTFPPPYKIDFLLVVNDPGINESFTILKPPHPHEGSLQEMILTWAFHQPLFELPTKQVA